MWKSNKTPVPHKGKFNIRNGGTRKPLRSLRELADEFGISAPALSTTMRHDPNGPRLKHLTKNKRTAQNTWFDPDDVRIWWKERKEKQT